MQYILQDIPLGKYIKEIRVSKGLTQSQVVKEMQLKGSTISRRTYSHIELCTRNIKASDLIIVKKVLQVSYESILGDLEE